MTSAIVVPPGQVMSYPASAGNRELTQTTGGALNVNIASTGGDAANLDPNGNPYVNSGSPNPAYISSFTFNPAATLANVDIVAIKNPVGSGKVIRILGFSYKLASTTAAPVQIALNYYTGAPSGGTPVVQGSIPFDSNSAAAVAVVDSYATTTQADGTFVGQLAGNTGDTIVTTTGLGNLIVYIPSLQGLGPFILRAGSYLGFFMTATAATGLTGTFQIVWTEAAA